MLQLRRPGVRRPATRSARSGEDRPPRSLYDAMVRRASVLLCLLLASSATGFAQTCDPAGDSEDCFKKAERLLSAGQHEQALLLVFGLCRNGKPEACLKTAELMRRRGLSRFAGTT